MVHILHDNTLTQDNRDKFVYIAGRYGQAVRFYNVEQLCANEISYFKEMNLAYTVGSIFRFMILNLFPKEIEKIIYLDSDVIINLDIKTLWEIDIGDKPLAAVPEIANESIDPQLFFPICREGFVKGENYFNSGVMVMNLERLRREEETLKKGFTFQSQHPRYIHFDQDVLNYCFSNDYVKLPRKFNRLVGSKRINGSLHAEDRICHYAGGTLQLNMDEAPNRLWVKCFAKTPWFNSDIIGRLYEGIRQIFIERQNFATQVSAVMSGKERAFFIPPENLDTAKKIFAISDSEEIIAAVTQESLQNLIDSMKKSRGKKIFFIFVGDFQAVGFELTKAGFVEGKDFLNALAFLSDAHGIHFDSYPLVKIM